MTRTVAVREMRGYVNIRKCKSVEKIFSKDNDMGLTYK